MILCIPASFMYIQKLKARRRAVQIVDPFQKTLKWSYSTVWSNLSSRTDPTFGWRSPNSQEPSQLHKNGRRTAYQRCFCPKNVAQDPAESLNLTWTIGVGTKTSNTAVWGDTGKMPLAVELYKQLPDYLNGLQGMSRDCHLWNSNSKNKKRWASKSLEDSTGLKFKNLLAQH